MLLIIINIFFSLQNREIAIDDIHPILKSTHNNVSTTKTA